MKKRSISAWVTVFLATGLFLMGSLVYGQENVWRIGTILPLTGPLAKNGIKNFDGVKIATDMINDQGGVLGKKVALVSADAPDPQAAASEANRLITNEKITAIIGTQASTLSMAATVVAEKAKVFYLENEGISAGITSRGFKYTFRTTFDSDMMAYQMIDFAADVIAPKIKKDAKSLRLAIVQEDGGFGTSTGKGLIGQGKGPEPERGCNRGLQRQNGRSFGAGDEAETGQTGHRSGRPVYQRFDPLPPADQGIEAEHDRHRDHRGPGQSRLRAGPRQGCRRGHGRGHPIGDFRPQAHGPAEEGCR